MQVPEVPQDFEILALGNSANQNAESVLNFKRSFESKQKKNDRKTSHRNKDGARGVFSGLLFIGSLRKPCTSATAAATSLNKWFK